MSTSNKEPFALFSLQHVDGKVVCQCDIFSPGGIPHARLEAVPVQVSADGLSLADDEPFAAVAKQAENLIKVCNGDESKMIPVSMMDLLQMLGEGLSSVSEDSSDQPPPSDGETSS